VPHRVQVAEDHLVDHALRSAGGQGGYARSRDTFSASHAALSMIQQRCHVRGQVE